MFKTSISHPVHTHTWVQFSSNFLSRDGDKLWRPHSYYFCYKGMITLIDLVPIKALIDV